MVSPPHLGEDLESLLRAWKDGDHSVIDRSWHVVYDELRGVARQIRRSRQAPESTTTLVHEAYLRLFESGSPSPNDRRHFFALAARAMRFAVVDKARRRMTNKRAHEIDTTPADQIVDRDTNAPEEVLAVHEALDQLESSHPRQRQIVEMHYYAGLTFDEITDALGISRSTVMREWRAARGWLKGILGADH